MRKVLVTLVFTCLVTFFISAPLKASLVEGTWDASNGLEQTGTWVEYFLGSYPEYVGNTGQITSTDNQWSSSGVRTGSDYNTLPIMEPGGYYTNNTAYFTSDIEFLFFDGNYYTATIPTVCTFQLHFGSTGVYLGADNMVWQGEGVINEDPSFSIYFTTYGYETWNNAALGTGIDHGGVITYASSTLSAVPIPSAIWLFGSSLLGLLGIKRRIL